MATPLRRALVQVHLWLGIGLGLYIVMMSLTGSAIVARRELTQHWMPTAIAAEGRAPLDAARLRESAAQYFPGHTITAVRQPPAPRRPPYPRNAPRYAPGSVAAPVEITFGQGNGQFTRRFDPYTGRDLGELLPAPYRAFLKIVALHDDLLGGHTGRVVNGAAALAATLLLLTGLLVWWPARASQWRRSLWVSRGVPGRTQLRQVHNVLGIWPWLLLLLWTLSGIYFAFPEPFEAIKEWLFPPDSPRASLGDDALAWFTSMHFGRFGGAGVRAAWIVLGLVPAALFVTGATMWWFSVLQPALRRARKG